ncbi:MAG: YoaK family protein [Beijerinckiaceae bacterium]|nr:YoaK family protein [Beijerinckiaceae bacterium]
MPSSPPIALEPPLGNDFSGSQPRFAAANSLAAAVTLSASAGFLDGFAYVGHGHTFASAMTGDLVLLGIAMTQSSSKALAYVYPLLAYVVGVIAANLLGRPGVRRRLPASLHFVTLLAEIVVLAAIPMLAGTLNDRILVAVITVSTAMQNTSFRNIGTRTYNSIIMTGNLQNFSNALVLGTEPDGQAARGQVLDLGLVIASFVSGATLGAYVTPRFQDFATLVPALLLSSLAAALFWSSDSRPAKGSGASFL